MNVGLTQQGLTVTSFQDGSTFAQRAVVYIWWLTDTYSTRTEVRTLAVSHGGVRGPTRKQSVVK